MMEVPAPGWWVAVRGLDPIPIILLDSISPL